VTDRQTDGRTDTAHIGNNSLHRMHSVQPKKYSFQAASNARNADYCYQYPRCLSVSLSVTAAHQVGAGMPKARNA